MDLDKILELTDSAEILAAVEECRAAQRAADHAHRARILLDVLEDMRDILFDASGMFDQEDMVNAIAAGKIRHLKIIY